MLLHFPLLHPELLTPGALAALPDGLLFLDPGLGPVGDGRRLRPEAAPFDPRMAKALLADTLRYGESVADPRDLVAQGLVQQLDASAALATETSRSVLAEVEQSLGAQPTPAAASVDALLEAWKQGQLLLLLAWNLEERVLEMQGIETRLRTAWDRLGGSVAAGEGVVDDGADDEAIALGRELAGLNLPDVSALALPWRKLLECFAVLAPTAVLCTTDAAIGATLAEAAVPEIPAAEVVGALRVFRGPAWRLMELQHRPEDRPWLEAPLTLALFAPAGE